MIKTTKRILELPVFEKRIQASGVCRNSGNKILKGFQTTNSFIFLLYLFLHKQLQSDKLQDKHKVIIEFDKTEHVQCSIIHSRW